jgi:hypothetical protein
LSSTAPGRNNTYKRIAEAAATAAAGAALAAIAWSIVDLAVAAAIVGGANGAIGGWRGIYRWRSVGGPLAFVLDSTWALPMTAAALVAHVAAAVQRARGNYVTELSERCNRHVYATGFTFRRGFMLTTGNVVSGVGDIRAKPRRAQTVAAHEHVHVWQARWFGPAYPLAYGLWWPLGAAWGVVRWALGGRNEKLRKVVDTVAYYSNPFEWWAYSREGRWPPPSALPRFTWRKPITGPQRLH